MNKFSFQNRILFWVWLSAVPAVVAALALAWTGDYEFKVRITLTATLLVWWLVVGWQGRQMVVRPLQTIANLLAAFREGDYSIRAHTSPVKGDVLSDIGAEINALESILRGQRLGAVEASALVRKVMEVIDVAVFTFDAESRLRLVNRAGEQLMARPSERLLGYTAEQLGLADCLEGDSPRTIQQNFPGKTGRWEMRRSTFREGGLPHQLLALADLSKALREEERQAWQRLVRVLGHELNNSLAPIKSMAGSLGSLLQRNPRPEDWEDDMIRGLRVINSRADALARFTEAYSRLARLPEPKFRSVDLGALVCRVAGLESRLLVAVEPGPEVMVEADSDQLEQLLINIIKNATDASLETKGGVSTGWDLTDHRVAVWVRDEGRGLPKTSNLFVPFFTTKPKGTGIGLVLSRQIAEAHGGSLTLKNRADREGCEARLELPR